MFCSNCGENLLATNQRFCHNCGSEVLAPSKATFYNTERIQNVPAPRIQNVPIPRIQNAPAPRPLYAPVKQQGQLQMGRPGKFSKLSLWLALGSIVIGIVSLIIGYNLNRFSYYPSYYSVGRLVAMIIILLLRVGGLIMGVFSKVNSSKAEIFEPYNDVEKAGSILGIFGILINSIGLFLSFLGPWSIFTFPMIME